MKHTPLIAALAAAVTLFGCAYNSANQSIKRDFQGRYSCPEVSINNLDETEGEVFGVPTVKSLRLMAEGCGVNAIYTCNGSGTCVQEKADERGYEGPGASGTVNRVPMPSGQALVVGMLEQAWLVADVSHDPPRVTFFQSTHGLNTQGDCALTLSADATPVQLQSLPGAAASEHEGCAAELNLKVLNQLAAAAQITGSARGVRLEMTAVELGTFREFARRVNEASKALQTLAHAR